MGGRLLLPMFMVFVGVSVTRLHGANMVEQIEILFTITLASCLQIFPL